MEGSGKSDYLCPPGREAVLGHNVSLTTGRHGNKLFPKKIPPKACRIKKKRYFCSRFERHRKGVTGGEKKNDTFIDILD